LPKGIERDDTVHNRLYYTKAQMLLYGQAREDAAILAMAPPKPGAPTGARPNAVDELLGRMGMK
jgi:hypothetical protein